MTTKPETNIEKAIAYIAKHPGCRSAEIEEKTGITFAAALLAPAVEAGYLVSCKISQPGKRSTNEYRLSATVAEDKVSWSDFRVAKRAKALRTEAKPRPMRTTNPTTIASKATQPLDPTTEEKPISHQPAELTVQTLEMGAPHPGIAPLLMRNDATNVSEGRPPTTEKPKLYFSLDNNGRLHISIGDEYLDLAPEAVRELGQFMVDTEPAWQ